ncbi:type I restriction enzyme M protein [Cryobacterium mesophilum]|uniref:site-specific DNA-methyltransferase (adenine-specific) n=1 Tax=Terrimesophilobacter mesophilus TaxID=433647 RepID=A0A4R8VDU3_9MICO|nr:class I SAM-dependent DNA methyltransferase [Terrimesophilobacter mesophilus]MBB5633635.1 type I restriction enzyme M protein [Terrimesophilobacter mesophilus]TFB80330.1 SAM-dependent DNA methyltransferase [Terrimesophilobacter mesophilus]
MALKKSDLYSSLWKGADELRGGMDASQYKDYVLTLLFVKYVTDKAKSDKNSLIDVPAGGSFDDLITFKGDKEIGDKVNKAIAKLAEANDLQKVIDLADFNDEEKLGKGKEMQDRLTNLISIFQDLDFRGSRAEGDDLLGDAYEYLMRHFATESGKSKGQFYTPAEVSRIMAQLIGIKPSTPYSATVYDPTCGSGSLLLKVADAAPHGLTIYGQEKDNATWALAKMNMILHGNEIADIRKGDTIASPQFTTNDRLDTFDFLVANPPFSVKSWANGLENEYGRFDGYGRPPEKNGDFAFLLHMLKSLKSTGKGAVILPHGVLFRGNAEATIRKVIIKRGYIKGIIGLPANLFYGTGIPACIIIIDKENAQARTGLFMIDASKGFEKDGPKNRLRPRDMHKITDAFTKQVEIPGYSRMVPLSEIENAANDFNLNIPRYIDSSEPEDIQDLHAHIHGGIPNRDIDALDAYWTAFPSLRFELLRPLREGYSELAVEKDDIQATITNSAEYQSFNSATGDLVSEWWSGHREQLAGISGTTRPGDLISGLSENLLDSFHPRPLVDEYAVYEQLMSYWNQTMHDDVALVMNEGWDGAAKPRKTIEDKDRKLSELPDLVIGSGRNASKYKMDLVPPALIVARYFADEKAKLDQLSAEVESAAQVIEELVEENSGEEGLFADAMDDGKITKALARVRLRDAKREDPRSDEVTALSKLIALYDVETAAKKSVKDAGTTLDQATLAQYGKLSIADIQQLVIEDKWRATVEQRIYAEVAGLTLRLITRITELGDRYDKTLSALSTEVEVQSAKVASSLAAMGVE